jgi:4-alpha-glucanotransferase
MAKDNYAWWIERLRMASATFDLIRIDHFRGFVAYWSIPASHKTAKRGHWVSGPGAKFFAAVEAQLGHLPIIAEDLGIITKEVTELRKEFRLPGMAVLQFAPSGPENVYLPHHYEPKTVVYTGTHDNDTTRGWWNSTTQAERRFMAQYLDRRPTAATITWQLIRLAFSSVADTAMIPLQDLLNLGSAARLNTPGTASGNWAWRYDPKLLTPALAQELLALTKLYSRTAD